MNTVEMAHGSGGQAMQQLINRLFMDAFNNPGSPSRKIRRALRSQPSPHTVTGWRSLPTAT